MINFFRKIWYIISQLLKTIIILNKYWIKNNKSNQLDINKIKKILLDKKINKIWNRFFIKQKKIIINRNSGGVNINDQKIFFFLISYFKPKNILEIGTHLGNSLNSMACCLKSNKLINTTIDTVDVYDVNKTNRFNKFKKRNSPINILKKNGISNKINFFKDGSDNFFLKNNKKYDLIFIDGNHTIDQAFKDIANAFNSLNKNGIIIIHDYYDIKNFNDLFTKIVGPFLAIYFLKKKIRKLKVIKIFKLGNLIRKKTTLAIIN